MNTNQNSIFNFSGAAMLETSKAGSIERTKSGLHTLTAVEAIESKSGHPTLKLVFEHAVAKDCKITDYVRTSSADNFVKSIMRARYAFINAKDGEAAKQALATLPNPVVPVMSSDNTPIVFQTNDELEQLRIVHGPDCDWIWAGKNSKDRYLVKLTNRQEFINGLAEAAKSLVGQTYNLKVSEPKTGETFQNIDSIEKVVK
jgi:hypothetical protein